MSDFSWKVGVSLFDLLTVTFQGQTFLDSSWPVMNCQKRFDLERSLEVGQISLRQLFGKNLTSIICDLFRDNFWHCGMWRSDSLGRMVLPQYTWSSGKTKTSYVPMQSGRKRYTVLMSSTWDSRVGVHFVGLLKHSPILLSHASEVGSPTNMTNHLGSKQWRDTGQGYSSPLLS